MNHKRIHSTAKPSQAVLSPSDMQHRKNYSIWVLLQQAKDSMLDVREYNLNKINLSNTEASILSIIQLIEHTPNLKPTPSEISRWLVREPHTISSLLSRMGKKGLITRTHDTERKNQVIVSISEKGYEKLRSSMEDTSIDAIFGHCSEAEMSSLFKCLLLLRDNSLAYLDKAPCIYPSAETWKDL